MADFVSQSMNALTWAVEGSFPALSAAVIDASWSMVEVF
jgi:hypothetical protein